jgi:hypothetical protein
VTHNENKKDRSNLLPLLLLLLAGFFVFLFLLPEDSKKAPIDQSIVKAKEFERKVNKHLFQTSQQMEISRERAELEAAKLMDQGIHSVPGVDPEKAPHPFDISTDSRAEALVRELGRDVKAPGAPSGPNDLIQAELFEAQQMQAYSEDYKKEYARQFIENAKNAGYAVKLNDQYKVISVKPLRKPAVKYDLFESKSGALQ